MGIFSLNPTKKLEKQYKNVLLQARDSQRNGEISRSAQLYAQAEEMQRKIETLVSQRS